MKIRMLGWIMLCTMLSFTTVGANPLGQEHVKTTYTLKSAVDGDRRLFIGVGGKIDGVVNPTLSVKEWEVLEIVLINDDGLNHHIAIPDFFIMSKEVMEKGTKTAVTFVPFKDGGFPYYCLLENHRQLGMEGRLIVVRK